MLKPPHYLLQTNYGAKLAQHSHESHKSVSDQNFTVRLAAKGVFGNFGELLDSELYKSHICDIVLDRAQGSETLGAEEAKQSGDSTARSREASVGTQDDVSMDYELEDDVVDNSEDDLGHETKHYPQPEPEESLETLVLKSRASTPTKYPLPTKWILGNEGQKKFLGRKKEERLEFANNGLKVQALSKSASTAKYRNFTTFLLKSNNCVPHDCGVFYYEIKINTNLKHYNLSLGFAKDSLVYVTKPDVAAVNSSIVVEEMPGNKYATWVYNGATGCAITKGSKKEFGFTFGHNDIVGCGINFYEKCIFFTKNGQYLNVAFEDINANYVVPVIGFNSDVVDTTTMRLSQRANASNSGLRGTNDALPSSLTHNNFHNWILERPASQYRSFASSYDTFNNDLVLHEFETNFGFGTDGTESGSSNFYFDINSYIAAIKGKVFRNINLTNYENTIGSGLSDLGPKTGEFVGKKVSRSSLTLKDVEVKSIINNLIKDYLSHQGYTETQAAFNEDLSNEKEADPESQTGPGSEIADESSLQRKHVRDSILKDQYEYVYALFKQQYSESPEFDKLMFNLQSLHLASLIRTAKHDNSDESLGVAIDSAKRLTKTYGNDPEKEKALTGMFRLLLTQKGPGGSEYSEYSELLDARNFYSAKLELADSLNSFMLEESGQSAVSKVEKLIGVTNHYLDVINESSEHHLDVLFVNVERDILK